MNSLFPVNSLSQEFSHRGNEGICVKQVGEMKGNFVFTTSLNCTVLYATKARCFTFIFYNVKKVTLISTNNGYKLVL